VAIHEQARFGNLERSIRKYLQDSIEGAGPIPASFPAAQIQWPGKAFDPDKYPYFLRPTLVDSEGVHFPRVTSAAGGFVKLVVLFLDLFIKHDYPRTRNNLSVLSDTLDVLKALFLGSTGITVKNYQGDGLTTLGKLWVRGRRPNQPKVDSSWLAGGWMIQLEWVEPDAAA
jgi:hypothetical protein